MFPGDFVEEVSCTGEASFFFIFSFSFFYTREAISISLGSFCVFLHKKCLISNKKVEASKFCRFLNAYFVHFKSCTARSPVHKISVQDLFKVNVFVFLRRIITK